MSNQNEVEAVAAALAEAEKAKRAKFVKLNEDGSAADITLSKPAMFAGVKITTLRMREPTISDQLAVNSISSLADREIALYANLMEQTPDDVKRLPVRDYGRLQDAWSLFID